MTQENFEGEDARLGYWDRAGVFHEGWPPAGMDASAYISSSVLSIALHDKAFAEGQEEFPKTGDVLGG